ncbi:hypothetical protein CkaCkLH20_10705 [Colletotrichum karsti]|uniref:Thioesterase domain-containing protein n=1 Tax=Colletotrichum karsti TaxID=1095194 RepID=A0A9P6LG33_9PEZI|nr:uncharacterized protein CkaCkLH20_10705 [Colletotrichum karsti]KAF9871771.1 hypothetical protein CkaCkLH20_10705 [Colletotrichum karsti]
MSRKPFSSRLEASSYHAPGGGPAYTALREKLVKQIIEQGYDADTMLEHGVVWADDQDPFGHVMGVAYSRFAAACNFRVVESFEAQLGDKVDDFINAKNVGMIVKEYTVDMKRQVSYPDSIICAIRYGEMRPDRYFITTTMWSLRQQAPVATTEGWVVFFDYRKGKVANLVELGGVYKDLYEALSAKCEKMKEASAAWKKAHPPKKKQQKL